MPSPMTRQEIEQKMDELAREYHDTHDPEIPEEIFELARRLRDGALKGQGSRSALRGYFYWGVWGGSGITLSMCTTTL
jgi:hypothetical protein